MKVEYDTRGLTSGCPQSGEQLSDECLRCPFHAGSDGFTVDCCYGQRFWEEVWVALEARAEIEAGR